MNNKRIHFRYTTAQQRRLLFETWEATGSVVEACRKVHVGRGTFYYWKARFEEQGYAGQALNVDLCFVAVEPEVASKLPAVSGSSGRLVVERCQTEAGEAQWPGRVFENPELTYEEAMLSFVVASQEDADQPGRRAEAAGQWWRVLVRLESGCVP